MILGPHLINIKPLENNDANYGHFEWKGLELGLWSGLGPTQMVEIVLHEVAHELLREVELPDATEELIAGRLGMGLADFVKDNPVWVTKFLQVFKEEKEKCQDLKT